MHIPIPTTSLFPSAGDLESGWGRRGEERREGERGDRQASLIARKLRAASDRPAFSLYSRYDPAIRADFSYATRAGGGGRKVQFKHASQTSRRVSIEIYPSHFSALRDTRLARTKTADDTVRLLKKRADLKDNIAVQ